MKNGLQQYFQIFNRSVIGVDITTRSVKMIELEIRQGNIVLKNLAQVPIYQADSRTSIISAVKNARIILGSATKRAVFAMGSGAIHTMVVTVDSNLGGLQLEQELRKVAEVKFPQVGQHCYLDYYIHGINQEDVTLLDVLLIVTAQHEVNFQVELLKTCGLKTIAVDAGQFALQRATLLDSDLSEKVILSLNFDQDVFDIILMQHSFLIATESFTLGHQELISVIYSFLERHKETRVDQIVLSGEFSHDLCGMIQEYTNIPTHIGNPFSKIAVSAKLDAMMVQKLAPEFMLCCGVALRGGSYAKQ